MFTFNIELSKTFGHKTAELRTFYLLCENRNQEKIIKIVLNYFFGPTEGQVVPINTKALGR